jgi:hypothetical protein
MKTKRRLLILVAAVVLGIVFQQTISLNETVEAKESGHRTVTVKKGIRFTGSPENTESLWNPSQSSTD